MTVSELMEVLQDLPSEMPVILSSDSEGNSYHQARGWATDMVCTDTYQVEIGYSEITPELSAGGYTEEDVVEGTPCLVLWP